MPRSTARGRAGEMTRHMRRHWFAHVLGWTVASATALFTLAEPSAPAHAAFSGENGRIVFDTIWSFWNFGEASQIYSVRADGGGLHQLTHVQPGSAAWQPAVSPDARRIAYVLSSGDSNDQLWI